MSIEMLMVLGLLTSFQPGDSCIDALHELRVMERMRIRSTDVLEDNVIAYTLTDGPRISSKTAILVCLRDVEDEETLDEGSSDEEEMALEDLEEGEELDEVDEVDEVDEETEPLLEDDEEAAE